MACGGDVRISAGGVVVGYYDAVGCLVRSRMLQLLVCCCQNTRRRRLWQLMSNTSRRRRSARVVDHDSEP